MLSALRRLFTLLAGLALLSGPVQATWSIVCVNLRTREVGVATATCLANFNIRVGVPVIVVGEGAAAAQSLLDSFGTNRRLIYFSYRDTDETPEEILARLAKGDFGHQTRQYGIVNFEGPPATFTGTGAGAAASGVTGGIGDYLYAIQGNVLTGDEVVLACEAAFRAAPGDMGQKMMAAMHAARELGGDGRCSCSNNQPTSCGVPPDDFEHSAYAATIVVARIGDENGGCNANRGCAKGEYHMKLNVIGNASDPDPVFRLQERYDTWRRGLSDVPDGLLSRVLAPQVMAADGRSETEVLVQLRDIEGAVLSHDDARVSVKPLDDSFTGGTIGEVVNHGHGVYGFSLRSGTRAGTERLVITAGARGVEATLYPYVEVQYVNPAPLIVDRHTLSASGPEGLNFVLEMPGRALRPFWIWAALDGGGRFVLEGAPWLPALIPLPSPFCPRAPLFLDAEGRARVSLSVPARALEAHVGREVSWTGLVLDGEPVWTNTMRTVIRP